MIFGECPYCNEPMFNSLWNGQLPAFQRLIVSCCNKPVWLKHSRIDPVAYSEENFLKEYKVNKETHEVEKVK